MPQELDELIFGYENFQKLYQSGTHYAFAKLAQAGQKPKALIIACADSRVDPGILFETSPGDIFVVRNVANLVPMFESDNAFHGTSAALEFGVCGLGIRHIIVLGHTLCGGIASMFQTKKSPKAGFSFINKWMELAEAAYLHTQKRHPKDDQAKQIDLCARYSLINSIRNLCSFPWIQERLKNKTLFLHAWYFQLDSGTILAFHENSHSFVKLKAPVQSISYTHACQEELSGVKLD